MWLLALTSSARGIVAQHHRRRLESSNVSQTCRVLNSKEMPRQGRSLGSSAAITTSNPRRAAWMSAQPATVTNERFASSIYQFSSRFEVQHIQVSERFGYHILIQASGIIKMSVEKGMHSGC